MNVWDVREIHDPSQLEVILAEPAARLHAGGLIAFPTETVYGLGANAWDDTAARRIFRAKGRPADNPLIVHIADLDMLDGVILHPDKLPDGVERAMAAFWPGPLTFILPAHPRLAPAVRPGMTTVGVRMPNHPVARTLIRLANCPVAAPSANTSGKPSPTTAGDVLEDLNQQIDGVVDGGACPIGVESTVVAITDERAVIYRPGGITPEQLSAVLRQPVVLDPHLTQPTDAPMAPGMKYRHYAPAAQVHVWWGDVEAIRSAVSAFIRQHAGQRLAALVPHGWREVVEPLHPLVWEAPATEPYAAALSRRLYHQLRAFDHEGVHHILVVGVPPEGLGAAVMNRLQKASEGRLYRV
ncbi:threonylcarbamoyl-AMP synthase [Alicyclobacillus contaminans]|uniref:L-threonylcarbamoyladenylate synthase n=1 Tax=Alicyclobacillus contaminans TaxID=392016 RepID=UPI00041C2B0D|nr:L-threonylcarbamoyladenylate synthase [Alicyclobacillus contaminans]GMA50902.1 threonylcarbamoyl-AMP synthase [Alicyclobacillus contaminans]